MGVIDEDRLERMDAYWRAANYLTVGQIYLQDNPLLRVPLRPEHIKPRLLGHWGTSPGLNLVYLHPESAHPGRGGEGGLPRGSWTRRDCRSGQRLARGHVHGGVSEGHAGRVGDALVLPPVLDPRGVPSHVSVPTPGSIHEGGELGYVLSHAFGAVFDNPHLLAVAVVGDGEAETSPLEGSWKGIKYLNPRRDGAVLPGATTIASRPMAVSWRRSRSTTATGGWRDTSSLGVMACSRPMRRSRWSRRR